MRFSSVSASGRLALLTVGFAVGLSSLGACYPSSTALQGDSLHEVAEETMPAVVRIDIELEDGNRQGSGFLVSPDGRLLTNHHVIEDAKQVEITLRSGDVYDRIGVLARDERRDLAVLKIPGFDLPHVPLGNSNSVRTGSDVLAIGAPHGLDNTVSTGIISARREEDEGYHVLQFTAPASQGSSGGPLLNSEGQVIAVASSKMPTGQNLNFALPINYARGLLRTVDSSRPVAVLGAEGGDDASETEEARDTGSTEEKNGGLSFATGVITDSVFSRTIRRPIGSDRRVTRDITVRRLDPIGTSGPQVERYERSVIREQRDAEDVGVAVRRERSRLRVRTEDLKPISAQGVISWHSGGTWTTLEYRLRFDGDHVSGTIRDTAGTTRNVERDLPPGTLLHGTRELALAALSAGSLVGRSVEMTTFDASAARLLHDRYDIRAVDTISVEDREVAALRVLRATGLRNRTEYYRPGRPRLRLYPDGRPVRQQGPAGASGADGSQRIRPSAPCRASPPG